MMMCKVSSPTVKVGMDNFVLPNFPPKDDFPVCIDSSGNVVSRFGDNQWDMTYWCGKIQMFTFDYDANDENSAAFNREARYSFKKLIVFLMWGAPGSISPATLTSTYYQLRKLFSFCGRNSISISKMFRYPILIHEFFSEVKSNGHILISLMRIVFKSQDVIGFKILTLSQIDDLLKIVSSIEKSQTAYIPPRISSHLLNKSFEMLSQFSANKDMFIDLFEFALEGFRKNQDTTITGCKVFYSPFSKKAKVRKGYVYYGPFASVAEEYGVAGIIRHWMYAPEHADTSKMTISTFSRYLTAISMVGASALAALSAMRQRELAGLEVDCFVTHSDAEYEDSHYICGPTTKTIQDSDARWVTCEDSKKIVDAMGIVARLRMKCAVESGIQHRQEEVDCPLLIVRPYEPWNGTDRKYPTRIRWNLTYDKIQRVCPGLFTGGVMIIQQQDLDIALAATPTLDSAKFAVGKNWPFALHQMRRTLLMNARKSNFVSLGTLQYQAKHLFQNMGRHYDRNFSKLAVNAELKEEYISTAYEVIAIKAQSLASPRYLSLLSPLHKQKLISFIEGKDLKQLLQMAKKGLLTIKETLMGVCLRGSYCPYGGADFILGCNDCSHGLVSKEKLPVIQQANDWIEDQLSGSPTGPKKESFEAQHKFTQELIALINVE